MYLKPKKRLGQNFLIDQNVQKKIIAACQFRPQDTVLEIGAGRGELTHLILDKVSRVYALEIDHHLCQILKDNFKKYKNVKILNQDALHFNFNKYFAKCENKIKVIGDIPYYITTPIIEYFLKYKDKIDTVFITVQKEFARRIVADCDCKEYGSFSCFVRYYTEPQIIFYIKKTCFRPVPKVDSSFLKLKIRETPAVRVKDERLFFKIIRAAFNQRRKTLRNSLRGTIFLKKLDRFFAIYGIDSNIRPENLTLADFANLANI